MNEKISKTAFADFCKKKKVMMDEIERNKETLIADLKAAVPKNLSKWRDECGDSTIGCLIENGQYSKYFLADNFDRRKFGFVLLKEFARRLKTLQKAWNSSVKISVRWENRSAFEITFKVK